MPGTMGRPMDACVAWLLGCVLGQLGFRMPLKDIPLFPNDAPGAPCLWVWTTSWTRASSSGFASFLFLFDIP